MNDNVIIAEPNQHGVDRKVKYVINIIILLIISYKFPSNS